MAASHASAPPTPPVATGSPAPIASFGGKVTGGNLGPAITMRPERLRELLALET